MLVSYHWLKKFIPIKANPTQVAEKITLNLVEVESITKRGEDSIFEIENKGITNRPDCFSHLGIARELAVYFNLPLKDPLIKLQEKKLGVEKKLPFKVKVSDTKLCPRYNTLVLTDIKVSPSPKWLRSAVENCGLRSINNVVDITNYVMLELGQPLHAFDYQKIEGKEIIVRRAKEDEEIITLDGIKRKLAKNILVIADAEKPIGIAGIIGGKNTEITKSTKTIVLESANFNRVNNRLASKFLKLRTEASTRFEKGQELNLTYPALMRAVELLKELAGAKTASKVFDLQFSKIQPWQVKVNHSWLNQFLGIKLTIKEIKSILEKLLLKTAVQEDFLFVTISTFRPDLTVEADIAEEVARIYGYDNIPITLPVGEMKPAKLNKEIFWKKQIKQWLANLGFTEVYTYPLIGQELIEKAGFKVEGRLKLLNPLTVEREYFRTTLIPSILEVIAKNQNFFKEIKVFEMGRIFLKRAKGKIEEKIMLVGALTGEKFYQVKGVTEALLNEMGIEDFKFTQVGFKIYDTIVSKIFKLNLWHPGRTAAVMLQNSPYKNQDCPSKNNLYKDNHSGKKGEKIGLGIVGEIHPSVLEKFGIDDRVTVFELDFEEIIKQATTTRTYTAIPKYPPIVEDLAFLVPEKTLVGEIIKEIKKLNNLVIKVELLDRYQNTRTFRITYQHPKRTLTDREVKEIREKIINKISKKFRAEIKKQQA